MGVEFNKCSNCEQYPSVGDYIRGFHKCPPSFFCQFDWQESEGDDPLSASIFADNERYAAEKFVENWDAKECELTESAIVIVTSTIERKRFRIEVSGEIVRSYGALHTKELPYIDPYGDDGEESEEFGEEEPEGEEVES